MNLVEACKLAKNLEDLKYQIACIISDTNYSTKAVEKHLKSAVDSTLQDESCEREVNKMYDITVDQAIVLLDKLMEKKALLSSAIERAKHDIEIDVNGIKLAYDSAVEYNKSLRDVAIRHIASLNRTKEGVTKSSGVAYRFNAEGNQTSYRYEIETEIELLVDIKETKKKEKEYRRLADEVSTKIDEAKLATKIDLELGIDVNDTLEDVIETLLS